MKTRPLAELGDEHFSELGRALGKGIDSLTELVSSTGIRFPVCLVRVSIQDKVRITADRGIRLGVALLDYLATIEGEERFQERWRNGHFINTGQRQDLIHIATFHGGTS